MKLEILTLCGSAKAIGGAITIKDATDRMYSDKPAGIISPCCFVFRIRFDPPELGNHTIKIELTNEDGEPLFPPVRKPIQATIPEGLSTGVNVGILNFERILFPKYGGYGLNFYVDEKLLGSQCLYCCPKT